MPSPDRLRRSCTSPSPLRWLVRAALLASAAVIAIGVFGVAPRVLRMLGDDCPQCDEHFAEALVFEAYPKWRRDHAATCPASIDELTPYVGGGDTTDQWGDPMELTCDAHHIVVHLRGEDKLANTADDFWRTFP